MEYSQENSINYWFYRLETTTYFPKMWLFCKTFSIILLFNLKNTCYLYIKMVRELVFTYSDNSDFRLYLTDQCLNSTYGKVSVLEVCHSAWVLWSLAYWVYCVTVEMWPFPLGGHLYNGTVWLKTIISRSMVISFVSLCIVFNGKLSQYLSNLP